MSSADAGDAASAAASAREDVEDLVAIESTVPSAHEDAGENMGLAADFARENEEDMLPAVAAASAQNSEEELPSLPVRATEAARLVVLS